MKLKGAKQVHYDSGPNMTPLVDVVMVILIFLMLTGSFGAVTHFLPSTMPIKQTGKGGIPKDKIPDVPDQPIEIIVPKPGADYVARMGQKTFATAEELERALVAIRQKHESEGTSRNKMQIIICPDLFTKYEQIIQVYQAAMGAEWPKIGFQSAR